MSSGLGHNIDDLLPDLVSKGRQPFLGKVPQVLWCLYFIEYHGYLTKKGPGYRVQAPGFKTLISLHPDYWTLNPI
jgi:hypothetical protein